MDTEPLIAAWSEYFVVVVIGVCVIVGFVLSTIKSIVTVNAKERSRREIAAYIAEGSMSPEQGERLMRAGPGGRGSRC